MLKKKCEKCEKVFINKKDKMCLKCAIEDDLFEFKDLYDEPPKKSLS